MITSAKCPGPQPKSIIVFSLLFMITSDAFFQIGLHIDFSESLDYSVLENILS